MRHTFYSGLRTRIVIYMNQLEALKAKLQTFADERDWDQFHSPKNLSMALSVEASELVECFQWLTEAQSQNLSPEQLSAAIDEMADVQIYLLRLATKLNVNMLDAVNQKIKKNALKYPVDKVKGSSKKYNQYGQKSDKDSTDNEAESWLFIRLPNSSLLMMYAQMPLLTLSKAKCPESWIETHLETNLSRGKTPYAICFRYWSILKYPHLQEYQ